jgi:hypothetical protein
MFCRRWLKRYCRHDEANNLRCLNNGWLVPIIIFDLIYALSCRFLHDPESGGLLCAGESQGLVLGRVLLNLVSRGGLLFKATASWENFGTDLTFNPLHRSQAEMDKARGVTTHFPMILEPP